MFEWLKTTGRNLWAILGYKYNDKAVLFCEELFVSPDSQSNIWRRRKKMKQIQQQHQKLYHNFYSCVFFSRIQWVLTLWVVLRCRSVINLIIESTEGLYMMLETSFRASFKYLLKDLFQKTSLLYFQDRDFYVFHVFVFVMS